MGGLLIRLKALVLINFSSRLSKQSSVILTPHFSLYRIALAFWENEFIRKVA